MLHLPTEPQAVRVGFGMVWYGLGWPAGPYASVQLTQHNTTQHNNDTNRLMEACSQRSSLHFYAVDVAGNTYSNGSKKATAVCL